LLPIVHWAIHNQTQFDNSVLFLYPDEQLHEKSVHREVKRLQYSLV